MMEIDAQYCSVWYKNLITLYIQINNEYRFTTPEKNILNVQTFFQSILKICRKSQKAHFIFQHDTNPALV